MLIDEISELLKIIRDKGLYPTVRTVQGISSDPEIKIDGKKLLLFCSANYLALANNLDIKNEIKKGLDIYGIHPTGSRLISGTLDVHLKLEKLIADYKNGEDSMLFTTGTMANIGTIPALINLPNLSVYSIFKSIIKNNDSVIFSDELNHATIIDGCRLAKATTQVYEHNNMVDLRKKLEKCRQKNKLIVTDGVFSMDGDIVNLPDLVKLAKEFDASIMLDDAHSTGVLGKFGKGTMEHFGIDSGVDIQMGTFSKAFGIMGGFIVGKKELIDYLRIFARTYMFTGGFFGSLSMGIIKSIEIVKNDHARREKLWWNSNYFRNNLKRIGFNTLKSETPIIPVFIGDEHKAISVSDELFSNGIFAPCVRWPSVEKKQSRIRFSIISSHTKDQLDLVLNTLEGMKNKFDL